MLKMAKYCNSSTAPLTLISSTEWMLTNALHHVDESTTSVPKSSVLQKLQEPYQAKRSLTTSTSSLWYPTSIYFSSIYRYGYCLTTSYTSCTVRWLRYVHFDMGVQMDLTSFDYQGTLLSLTLRISVLTVSEIREQGSLFILFFSWPSIRVDITEGIPKQCALNFPE